MEQVVKKPDLLKVLLILTFVGTDTYFCGERADDVLEPGSFWVFRSD